MQSTDSPAGREKAISNLAGLPPDLFRGLLAPKPLDRTLSDKAREAGQGACVVWQDIVTEADAHGIGVLLHQRLTELGLGKLLDPQTERALEADARHAQLQCALQRQDAILISEVLSELGVRHAFLKGFAYRAWLYQPTWVRPGSDIDILIDPEAIETVRAAMLEIGFIQASRSWNFTNFRPATAREIRQTEATHYELAQFARSLLLKNPPDWLFGPDFTRGAPFTFEQLPQGPVLHSVVDVHWALHSFWEKETPLDVIVLMAISEGDDEIPTLSLEWNLLFSSFKLYFEAFDRPGRGLHKLVDLAALLAAHHHEIDWEWYADMIAHYKLQAASFYTFSAVQRLADKTLIPDRLMRTWSRVEPLAEGQGEDKRPSETLDFGDFLSTLLGTRIPSSFLYPLPAAPQKPGRRQRTESR
ncbi:MAG: nucleotidyltransferase family protein [Thermoanaerobaculia bacterium]